MEQKPRWNWVITLAAVFLAFCLGFGVARWTQHTDGVTVRTARTVPAQAESALPSVPAAAAPTEGPTAAPTEAATQPPTEPGPLDLNHATAQELTTLPGIGEVLASLLNEAAPQGEGEVLFSAQDRETVGRAAVDSANAQNGGQLTLSDETVGIPGGFILRDGSIEVNCAYDTLIRLQKTETAGQVARQLFG